MASLDHSFLLQIVTDIQKTLGRIEEKAEATKADVAKLEKRIDALQDKLDTRFESLSEKTSGLASDVKSAKTVVTFTGTTIGIIIAATAGIGIPVLFKILDVAKSLLIQKLQ